MKWGSGQNGWGGHGHGLNMVAPRALVPHKVLLTDQLPDPPGQSWGAGKAGVQGSSEAPGSAFISEKQNYSCPRAEWTQLLPQMGQVRHIRVTQGCPLAVAGRGGW